MTDAIGRAEACANIALAKYWGKSPKGDNLTAVPSLSLTLDALRTRTEVRFSSALEADEATLDGVPLTGRPLVRISEMLDRVRAQSGEQRRAFVTTQNDFPTAAGLASSASGFAALALAAARAAHLKASPSALSALARQSSASAARSLFGGFVELLAEAPSATPLAAASHWPLTMLVAVVAKGPKGTASTGGMIHTAATSPFYPSWVEDAPRVFHRVREAVLARDFDTLAHGMEHSALMMHATMLAADPPILYFQAATVELLSALRGWRTEGLPLGFTMDAGPNVKVLTPQEHAPPLAARLQSFPGVTSVILCKPGPGAQALALEGALQDARPSSAPLEARLG